MAVRKNMRTSPEFTFVVAPVVRSRTEPRGMVVDIEQLRISTNLEEAVEKIGAFKGGVYAAWVLSRSNPRAEMVKWARKHTPDSGWVFTEHGHVVPLPQEYVRDAPVEG